MSEEALSEYRDRMVEQQLRRRGIADPRVLEAMRRVPRHIYAGESNPQLAYADHPLPIGHRQTISQPYMVARMVELCELGPEDRVLEIGAGSGYQTAVLAELCQHVYGAEIVVELAELAARRLAEQRVTNATIEHRDGSSGWPEHAPFDAIVVAAGAPTVPEPLKQQLADGGRLVIPVGDRYVQTLERHTRQGDAFARTTDTACRFVHLQGEHGWSSDW